MLTSAALRTRAPECELGTMGLETPTFQIRHTSSATTGQLTWASWPLGSSTLTGKLARAPVSCSTKSIRVWPLRRTPSASKQWTQLDTGSAAETGLRSTPPVTALLSGGQQAPTLMRVCSGLLPPPVDCLPLVVVVIPLVVILWLSSSLSLSYTHYHLYLLL